MFLESIVQQYERQVSKEQDLTFEYVEKKFKEKNKKLRKMY